MAWPAAPPRPRVSRLRRLSALATIAAAAPGAAAAGPWITEAEEFAIGSIAFRGAGAPALAAADAYFERPLIKRRMSLVGRAAHYRFEDDRRNEIEAGAKVAFAPASGVAVAIQSGPIWAERLIPHGCEGFGGEARLGGGASWRNGAYVAAEVAERWFERGCAESRGEATIGLSRGRRLYLGQAFVDQRPGAADAIQTQVSMVTFRRGLGLQVGLRTRVDGRAQEAALVVGVWAKSAAQGPR